MSAAVTEAFIRLHEKGWLLSKIVSDGQLK